MYDENLSLEELDHAKVCEILTRRNRCQGIHSLKDLPKPYTLDRVQEGAKLLVQCIKQNQKILIVGDYDADGVCASAIMMQFFEAIDYPFVKVIIPNRFTDGYGVSAALLEKYAHDVSLVVSVDNGITAFCAGEFCKDHQMSFIITDHHTPVSTLPDADVIIDPKIPSCQFIQKDICGAMVAWYFCAGIKQELQASVDMKAFLGYLALASIGDIMPLCSVNYMIVKKGIHWIQTADAPFAQIIRSKIKNINAENLAFKIIPLLNCAGRIDDASLALQFLCADTLEHAQEVYFQLESLNIKRKQIQDSLLESAQNNIITTQYFVLSYGEGWHSGVLGIVAAQLAEIYQKSSFVLSLENGILKGSARSYGGLNLIESVNQVGEHLLTYGGHSGALGLSLYQHNMESFIQALQCNLIFTQKSSLEILGLMPFAQINVDLLCIIESFEPFGEGNPKPIFLTRELCIVASKPLGKEKKHYRYILQDKQNNICHNGIEFFVSQIRKVGCIYDVTYEINRDDYTKGVILKIIEMHEKVI